MTRHLPSADAVPVDTLRLDDFETGLLAVLRHFLTAYAHPDSQSWQAAFQIAAERWGQARGPQVAMGLLSVLQTLRGARRGPFDFANPLCRTCRTWATGSEVAFLAMIQAMRRDRTDLARPAVLRLTEGTMDPGLIRAALAFAARHPAGPDAQTFTPAETSAPAPRHLRLVH
ncbi:hypothetical protein [Gemmobacter sp. LW-1]|jgi:hypothetical protein|uniref:hypothetical protein n=1 Tax=Gemmobacter sp. LW-1 TaxID=1529005 RepID=UPI0006C755D3|nr:hypothetical protein [Gemmobacter sp. LW-1]